MTHVSGFSFIHNALEGGYPIVQAIQAVKPFVDDVFVVDMQSTDGTRDLLEKAGAIVLDGEWIPGKGSNGPESCLALAHAMNVQCTGDVIIHFEADEVYDASLLHEISLSVTRQNYRNIVVQRVQIEQNFQRIRWYPEWVHRVWPKGSTEKRDHTTIQHDGGLRDAGALSSSSGMLWDVTYNFRDNLIQRFKNNAELYGGEPNYMMVPRHFALPAKLSLQELIDLMGEYHWTWKHSMFDLPRPLERLVGVTKYEG